jgi:membrane-bound metal-dependent hydrolase YbcI (DUF457 family)
MQTYSHFLITAVLGDRLKKKEITFSNKALLVGSFLPDIPLFLLTIGYFVYRQTNAAISDDFIFGPNYDQLYFENPWWILGHNLFHAPLLILLYGVIGWFAWRRGRPWGLVLLWFAIGCGLHSIIDIFTHVDDGPVLFFPLNWSYRFPAPVSYWDPEHGGRIFGPLEHLLVLILLNYFLLNWIRNRRLKKANLHTNP